MTMKIEKLADESHCLCMNLFYLTPMHIALPLDTYVEGGSILSCQYNYLFATSSPLFAPRKYTVHNIYASNSSRV